MAEKRQSNDELSLIGSGTVVKGKVVTEGSIRIDGTMVGDVSTKANAAIGATGMLEGNLSAKNISLAGKVSGTLTASEKIILESKSVLRGDIKAAKLVVDEGAMFDGQCSMSSDTAQPDAELTPR